MVPQDRVAQQDHSLAQRYINGVYLDIIKLDASNPKSEICSPRLCRLGRLRPQIHVRSAVSGTAEEIQRSHQAGKAMGWETISASRNVRATR
jgi:hypothetical protein